MYMFVLSRKPKTKQRQCYKLQASSEYNLLLNMSINATSSTTITYHITRNTYVNILTTYTYHKTKSTNATITATITYHITRNAHVKILTTYTYHKA